MNKQLFSFSFFQSQDEPKTKPTTLERTVRHCNKWKKRTYTREKTIIELEEKIDVLESELQKCVDLNEEILDLKYENGLYKEENSLLKSENRKLKKEITELDAKLQSLRAATDEALYEPSKDLTVSLVPIFL